MVAVLRPIDRIILHCSATPDYDVEYVPYDYDVRDVDAWHRARGWSGIGYHFFIRRLGAVEPGRDLARVGAHTEGHNTGSIGVCYAGTAKPTPGQLDSIVGLGQQFKRDYGLTSAAWFGHNDFTKHKTCPGFSINMIRALLKSAGV